MKYSKNIFAIVLLTLCVSTQAIADSDGRRWHKSGDLVVMTQNQYLGADLTPIVAAPTPEAFNAEVINALISIGNNNLPERAKAMARSIAFTRPHLVALQEVYEFQCIDAGGGHCALFQGAFNDHLSVTMSALDELGANYTVAAIVQNLTLPPPDLGLPGIPVFLAANSPPAFFVRVIDRDVILARSDIDTSVVDFGCAEERRSLDGCNFNTVAETALPSPIPDAPPIPVRIERGFVGVDAEIDGASYRFVNTHLEVQNPSPDPAAPILQAAQASELWGAILMNMQFGQRLIVAGDINSSPDDPAFPISAETTVQPPYQQFINGTDLFGTPLPYALGDVWSQLRFPRPGYTCCQLADLSNAQSLLDERVDMIFAFPRPERVRATRVGAWWWTKTLSGLWPSDHAGVVARLRY